jgi:hypothetical protein
MWRKNRKYLSRGCSSLVIESGPTVGSSECCALYRGEPGEISDCYQVTNKGLLTLPFGIVRL